MVVIHNLSGDCGIPVRTCWRSDREHFFISKECAGTLSKDICGEDLHSILKSIVFIYESSYRLEERRLQSVSQLQGIVSFELHFEPDLLNCIVETAAAQVSVEF